MKKISILLIGFIAAIVFTGCSNSSSKQKASSDSSASEAKASAIDGAWETVWAKYNGKDQQLRRPSQFKLFSNGFFALTAWDSTGKFSYSGFGKYELDGNMYKETFLYHNNPNYTGAKDWQEFEMKGDTLIMRGFNKVIVGGKDVTVDFPKIEEKRVLVK